jgi:signal transduction histidine kinase
VRDTGMGIPEADLEHIFERFYRVEGARARNVGGTGLGLAIVRHVVGNHHGEVRVESEVGQGSTFVLRLPAGPALAAPAAATASPNPARAG